MCQSLSMSRGLWAVGEQCGVSMSLAQQVRIRRLGLNLDWSCATQWRIQGDATASTPLPFA